MTKRIWIVAAITLGVAQLHAADALAQCAVTGAKGASKQKIKLNRAYAACAAPDVATVDGIPACSGAAPVAGQWAADPARTKGQLAIKSEKDGNVSIDLKVSGVIEAGDLVTPATGTGTLQLTVALTTDDPVEGLVTTVPFEVSLPVTMDKGKVKVKSSLNDMLGLAGLNVLGECWSAEIGGIAFEEPGGSFFFQGSVPSFSERVPTCCSSRG
jgi:hypothetical protein